jgi:CAAX protease family protein
MKLFREKPLLSFLFLTWLFSWPFFLYGSGILQRQASDPSAFQWLVAEVGCFGPATAALIVSGGQRRELRQNNLRTAFVLVLMLALSMWIGYEMTATKAHLNVLSSLPAVLMASAVVGFFSPRNHRLRNLGTGRPYEQAKAIWYVLAALALPALLLRANNVKIWEVSISFGSWPGSSRPVVVVLGTYLILSGVVGEEVGWRGFALPTLLEKNSPLAASFILGLIWAIWHAPFDLRFGFWLHGPGAIVTRIIWIMPLTIVFTWFYIKSKGSLLVAIFLHASVNISASLDPLRAPESTVVFWFVLVIWAFLAGRSRTMRQKPLRERPQLRNLVDGAVKDAARELSDFLESVDWQQSDSGTSRSLGEKKR